MTKYSRAIEALRLHAESDRQNAAAAAAHADRAGAEQYQQAGAHLAEAIALLQEYDEGMTEDRG